jgi:hypothetical protein
MRFLIQLDSSPFVGVKLILPSTFCTNIPHHIWTQYPIKVFDHGFPSDSQGIVIPYGIYDLSRNEGFVCVGTSRDTSEFAVDSIRTWWLQAGSSHYPSADTEYTPDSSYIPLSHL